MQWVLQTNRQTKEDVEKGCAKRLPSTNLNRKNAINVSIWKKPDGGWVNVSSGTGSPG